MKVMSLKCRAPLDTLEAASARYDLYGEREYVSELG